MNKKLSKNSIVKLDCNVNTRCCEYEKLILLSPYDLYEIAKKLGITVNDLMIEYCDNIEGERSKLPLVALESEKCPFFQEKECVAGKEKPYKCKIFPLKNGISTRKGVFYTNSATSGKKGQKVSVEEWLKKKGVTDEEEWYEKEWYELSNKIVKFIYTKIPSIEEYILFFSALQIMLYMFYDTKKDFYPQFKENAQNIKEYMESLEKDFNILKDK